MLSSLGFSSSGKSKDETEKDKPEMSSHEKYLAKVEAIEDSKGSAAIDSEELSAEMNRFTANLIKSTKKTMGAIKDAMTPEFVNRIFNARSYKHHVVQTDK
jgi:hypothetical protein